MGKNESLKELQGKIWENREKRGKVEKKEEKSRKKRKSEGKMKENEIMHKHVILLT